MTATKGEFLLKCDCERTKSVNQVRDKTIRKYLYISGVVIVFAVFAFISSFVLYTLLRINHLENEISRLEQTFKETMKLHEDTHKLVDPIILGVSKNLFLGDNKWKCFVRTIFLCVGS